MNNDSLGDRMKTYEAVSQSFLTRRMPVIIRVDGKAFHTFTKSFTPDNDPSLNNGPFSHVLHNIMTATAGYLMIKMQNSVFAYTQSDEISILLRDWATIQTESWFNNNLQKIVSVSAAFASAGFNFFLREYYDNQRNLKPMPAGNYTISADTTPYTGTPVPSWSGDLPVFDARAFILPKEEVTNYFIWRQQDATRNSVNMLGRFYYSHKSLLNKTISDVKDMLYNEHNCNWNSIDTWKKRGTGLTFRVDPTHITPYVIDEEMPIITEDRTYIERFL